MIYIKKGPEPEAFRQWKEQNPEATYGEIPKDVGLALRNALLLEQGFVCCFCGCAIGPFGDKGEIDQIPLESIRPHNIRNAHIVPQSKDTAKTLDFGNLCASCNTSRHTKDDKHCDEAQGNRELPVSPLQKDCISYFSFGSDGEIFANAERTEEEQERAKATISILRLNTNSLVTARYDTIEELESLSVEDRAPLLDLLCKRNAQGAFVPYYFVPLRHFKRI